ncbi:probable membrane-associated kinase regulator 2 [Gastrolobium bilobum]|uniref:probable membrane-associated kinase regulator 2 n=1 Tax=Gastrolobium bilobum TaxID=150636 RepID=UPI002AB2A2A9|nr:probable membrane-associated kinase regulator 2 [Gastrolobium bilobum]
MEAFSLLKYWKGGGPLPPPSAPAPDATSTSILSAEVETDDDEGPFFDLEFTVPDEEEEEEAAAANDSHVNENPNANHSEDEDHEEDDDEFKFTLSPSSNDRSDPNLSLSPSDDLFFKGKVVQLEPVLNSSEPNSKAASLLKSATKFRVFRLGLKKSKSNGSDSVSSNPKQQQRKLFTVKFKVEEVPIVSLFTRDNSSRGGGGGGTSVSANKAPHNQNTEESQSQSQSPSEEKRFSKEVMQKYLKKVKPLYVKVSRRYAEKLRFSGQLNIASTGSGKSAPSPAKAVAEKAQTEAEVKGQNQNQNQNQKQGNLPLPLPAGLRDVCKHLGKSRSASSTAPLVSSRRRDDSLLQQQDGIQGAILHCKRSFNASRECQSSQLPRSVSDPLHEISPQLSRKSTNESKDAFEI